MGTKLIAGTETGVVQIGVDAKGAASATAAKIPSWGVESVVSSPEGPSVFLAGTRGDGVWRSTDGAATFDKCGYGRPGPGKVRRIALDPHRLGHVLVGTEPIELYASDDPQKGFDEVASLTELSFVSEIGYPLSTTEPHVRDIAFDPVRSGVVYVALQVGSIVKSTDGGESWERLTDGLDADVHAILVDRRDPDHVLIATGGENASRGLVAGRALYQSFDAGSHFVPMAMEFTQRYSLPITQCGQGEVILAGLANGTPGAWRSRESGAEGVLARSGDGGATWSEVAIGELSNGARAMVVAIAVDPGDPFHVVIGLANGRLGVSHDAGAHFDGLDVEVPGINDLLIPAA